MVTAEVEWYAAGLREEALREGLRGSNPTCSMFNRERRRVRASGQEIEIDIYIEGHVNEK
jgi:hypothetical protein